MYFNIAYNNDTQYYLKRIDITEQQKQMINGTPYTQQQVLVGDNRLYQMLLGERKFILGIDPGSIKMAFTFIFADNGQPWISFSLERDDNRVLEKANPTEFTNKMREIFFNVLSDNKELIEGVCIEDPYQNIMAQKNKSTYPILKSIYDNIKNETKRVGINFLSCKPSMWKSIFIKEYGWEYLKSQGIRNVNMTKSNKDIIHLIFRNDFPGIRWLNKNVQEDSGDAYGIARFYYETKASNEGTLDDPINIQPAGVKDYKCRYITGFGNATNTMAYLDKLEKSYPNRKVKYFNMTDSLSYDENIRTVIGEFGYDVIGVVVMNHANLSHLVEIIRRKDSEMISTLNEIIYSVFYKI